MTPDEAIEQLTKYVPTIEERKQAQSITVDVIKTLVAREATFSIVLIALVATLESLAFDMKIPLAELHNLIDAMRTMSRSGN